MPGFWLFFLLFSFWLFFFCLCFFFVFENLVLKLILQRYQKLRNSAILRGISKNIMYFTAGYYHCPAMRILTKEPFEVFHKTTTSTTTKTKQNKNTVPVEKLTMCFDMFRIFHTYKYTRTDYSVWKYYAAN